MNNRPVQLVIVTLVTAGSLILFFQNCSSGFQLNQVTSSNLDSTTDSTGLPAAMPSPSATTASTATNTTAAPATASTSASAVGTIAVTQPVAWQVFQRDASNSGRVVVRGTTSRPASTIDVYVWNSIGTIVERQVFAVAATAAFSVSLQAPAGGWYSMNVFANDANGVSIGRADVYPFAVGEVFVTGGQSNSTNSGQVIEPSGPQVSTAKLMSGVFKWRQPIDDPTVDWVTLPGTTTTQQLGTAWPVFANQIAAEYNVPVAIIPVGCGGTTAAQWLPSDRSPASLGTAVCGSDVKNAGDLFQRLLTGISVAGGAPRAVLWHQGESDTYAATSTNDYVNTLVTMIGQMDYHSGQQTFFLANASYAPGNEVDLATCAGTGQPMTYQPQMDLVRAAQQQLWTWNWAKPGPDTDPMWGSIYRYPGAVGNCIHMNDNGLKTHGTLWAQKVSQSGIIPTAAPLSGAQVQSQISKLYTTLLDRMPDPSGMTVFENAIAHGSTIAQVQASIMASAEYKSTRH